MVRLTNLLVLAAVLLVGGTASAEVIWKGDYESGDLTQWSKAQSVAPERLEVVSDPVNQGSYALKATVNQGDNPIGASGNRNELVYASFEPTGTERYYRWQTMFAPDFPCPDTWQLFTQWHHSGDGGSPPVQFVARRDLVILSVDNKGVWKMPLERGRWIDFVLHVKWSPDANEGFVELWVDGKLVLPKMMTRTQFPGQSQYLKQGLYRDVSVGPTGIVYHDGFTIGTQLSDVMPVGGDNNDQSQAVVGSDPAADGTGSVSGPGLDGQTAGGGGGGGCSAAPGAPILGAAFALVSLIRRKRQAAKKA